ncbi:hypothetical protein [Stieleria varia]|uniref:Uncharacterized protein n=1 Tax=Stieleria varia TaxID=2528005 RepID=A0A5C6B4U6_9BACT|nr:hypothetical protein [Stieleria varia]TWU06329.1 hypothetical protein Pla52n_20500 [Stieleria varia]
MNTPHAIPRVLGLLVLFVVLIAKTAFAADGRMALIDAEKPMGGWTFDNGQEFPGAVGNLELQPGSSPPTLVLHGDFSGGGNYVQAAKSLPDISIDSIAFDIKVPAGIGKVTTRLIDGTGQCHQLDIRLNDKGGWQRYTFPVARYFASLEAGSPMDIVSRYEKWSGANDGRWHQPLKLFVILAGKETLREGSIAIRDVTVIPTPPKTEVAATIRLDEFGESGTGNWEYNNGDEFKGATGGLKVIETSDQNRALQLAADFSGGGRYVGVRQRLNSSAVKTTKMIRLKLKGENVSQYSLRLVDETGQCHQRGGLKVSSDGQWHTVELDPTEIAGGEHWAGANDGQWHGALTLIELMLSTASSDGGPMKLEIADIQADVIVEAQESAASWSDDFEASGSVWIPQGGVSLAEAGKGGKAMHLHRTLDDLQTPTIATSPWFPVRRGQHIIRYRTKSALHSPDNSFHVAVTLELADASGHAVDTIPLGITFGDSDWSEKDATVAVSEETTMARLRVELKKTYGEFYIDDITMSRLEVQPLEQTVKDIRIATAAVGNLFLPNDPLAFQFTVNTAKPLSPADQWIRCSVRDYRGDDVLSLSESKLTRSSGGNAYTTSVTLPAEKLNVGQFYELHVAVPQGLGADAAEFCGFAILPEAAAKQFEPEKIPFTIRNWDSRIGDYFLLADRLGIRMMGVWGGWSNEPPYRPHLPGLEVCEKLGAKWVTGTPASEVERNGFAKVSEESLRRGMTNFLKAYADRGLAMIAQGNEPHGTGQKVLDNVKAYKAIYESVKAFDPNIEVIGTSVEPNEEYFQAGYQEYLDSYDFHVYEHYTSVRKVMRQYRELMKKYDAVKPIHSTELGLNSQGQTRLAVAIELIKKCTVFFAEGGKTVSWFTIQYPDPKGRARGQFGDSHCVFDCKFNNYNPRLDAIAYYNMINALTDKRFVREDQREDGSQVFVFQNDAGETLVVAWNDTKETEITIGVPVEAEVETIRIDGQRGQIAVQDGTARVGVAEEPVMLLYRNASAQE